MTRGVDELVEFLLSEVALTGVQGAGSADFKRFVQAFYEKSQDEDASRPSSRPNQLGRAFYERVWHWVSSHADIRITHDGVLRQYSLAEFEAAENTGTVVAGGASLSQSADSLQRTKQKQGPAKSLLALRDSIRQRVAKESLVPQPLTAPAISTIRQLASSQDANSDRLPLHAYRRPRALPVKANDVETIFDDPPTNTTAPRLYASQSRIWQALTGHGIDLKKVPTMEFILLSLIASHGAAGVTQPDLTVMSGQDKRSVPHRTDELCRKGYIEKRPVQAGKLRTSLCVHKKFVSDDHFLTSGKVEDVFQYKKFVLSGFVHLLYNTLKDAGVVPTRDIRKRLNVPMSTWNKRAVQGALIRLDQTGMVKRFRARRKDAEDNWLTCIEVLREPRPEDHDNLKFRRQATMDEAVDEQSDEDVDGDTLMRDLEVDMLNSDTKGAAGDTEDGGRIPPQWVPERLLSNTLYEVIAMGGSEGWDSGILRDRIVGKFWRRPMESYLTRLTDDWEKTQPAHLRHLALIRDTRNTQEKKFVHYVYRTYKNFQSAVDAGEVIWAGVSKPPPKQPSVAKGGRPKKDTSKDKPVDPWGFRTLSLKEFLGKDSSGSLSECREAIVHGRKYGPRWDNLLTDGIGYQKSEEPRLDKPKWTNDMSRSRAKAKLNFSALATPMPEGSLPTPTEETFEADAATESEHGTPAPATKVMGLPKRKHESGLLTIEQRITLGLKPKGRLSKFVEDQIRDHRKRTGDPASVPDSVVHESPSAKPTDSKRGPLMTKEERIAAGLPARGRLGQKIEDQIREQRGLPKSVVKVKKPRTKSSNEPALLSKQQRIQFGIIPHGRLPQSLMEGLREEREFDIALEQSNVLPVYLGAVKDRTSKAEITRVIDEVRAQTLRQYDPSRELNQDDTSTSLLNGNDEPLEIMSRANTPNLEKRKAGDDATIPQPPKRMRVERDVTPEGRSTVTSTPPPTVSAGHDNVAQEQTEQGGTVVVNAEDEDLFTVAGASEQSSPEATTPLREDPLLIDLAEVDEKVRLIKETYENRSAPGIYTNPFAKLKITKGRPRNAFIATFRLEELSTLEWFIDDTTEAIEKPATYNVLQSSRSVTVASPVAEQETYQNATPGVGGESGDSCLELAGNIGADLSASGRNDSPPVSPSPVQEHNTIVAKHSDEPIKPGQARALQSTPEEVESTSRQSLDSSQTVQHQTRPVAGWNAINRPSPPPATYQSPYAISDRPEPATPNRASPESEATEQTAQDSIGDTQIQGVCGPITEADTFSRSARKLAAYMGTKTGGGSQKIFRHKIILQIIDLCNGVYPMHGEIGRPFVTLWKQQHPDTPPPNSSTVLSNLRDMIADPHSGLKKFSFLIRLRQSAGLKKKDMVVYQHLTPTSPQVTKLAYNMANYSNTKAHQYYPDEIRHLVSDESFYVPMPVAPKDETVSLERLNPSLQNKIKEANLERRRRYYHKQKNEDLARDAQNAAVEVPLKQATKTDGQPRTKRTRLASLNDKKKRYRRAPLSNMTLGLVEEELEELEESVVEDVSLPDDLPERNKTLTWKKPWVGPVAHSGVLSSLSRKETTASAIQKDTLVEYHTSSITAPIVRFYSTNGTFSTEFGLVGKSDSTEMLRLWKPVKNTVAALKSKKRVRIVEPASQHSNKKARLSTIGSTTAARTEYINVPDEEIEDFQSSSTSSSSSEDDDMPLLHLSNAKSKARARAKAQAKTKAQQRRSEKELPPTLLERLTGLTGDPNGPLYFPPKPKAHSQKPYKAWTERKRNRFNKQQRDRKYAESYDPVDTFKRLCCALVIASSMAGKDGRVDWNIVERVHNTKGFDIRKTKALWTWMQTNMAPQLANLATDFQTRFLEAYESNRVSAIEDPETYDWANLVRWAMHTCVYPDLSLPVYREALQHFIIDLSSFEIMDRPKWHREKIADRVRTQLQLQYPFIAPLHQPNTNSPSVGMKELKARSWIRANTATPQAVYDSKTAHEKLETLGDRVLSKVVAEYVNRQMLRMRKLKRLLPGRNYTFTARLAKKYGRTFELSDFMAAVKVKKEMDTAFTQDKPEQRVYSVSRAESDGAIMAIMSLLSDGKVRLLPKLPPVKNEFGAPLPRLSVWGFMEGDYVHRGIDRQRLFWDVHVVPTITYDYGSPLQPSFIDQAGSFMTWLPLMEPPLPGKQDPNALLPIWSSMDGQHVTWPWWYRILNLVLQPLIFQPGATIEDIHANCDEYTTEIFEIELVLQWLVSVNAIKKTAGGGYITLPAVWAAFGDVLYDMNNDWLNTHVKRKHENHAQQQWHGNHDLRYSTLRGRNTLEIQSRSDESDEFDTQTDYDRRNDARPDEQYAVLQSQVATATPKTFVDDEIVDVTEQNVRPSVTPESEADEAHDLGAVATQRQGDGTEDANVDHETHAEGDIRSAGQSSERYSSATRDC